MRGKKLSDKPPFRYQVTDVDCFPTTVINALIHFFGRKIPGEVIKMIYCFSLDDINNKGKIQGTKSYTSVKKLDSFVKVRTNILKSEDVDLDKIESCLNQKGVAICSIYDIEKVGHSVLVLKIDDEWVYIWDPYPYRVDTIEKKCPKDVQIENDTLGREPNIKVSRKRFNSYKKTEFSLGEKDRECCLLWRA